MPPKKQQRNGFWYFMQDYKKREKQSSSKAFPAGLRWVQNDPKCSKEWQNLPYEEKQRYNNMAKKNQEEGVKLTGWGEPINDVLARKRKSEEFESQMKTEIQETIEKAQMCNNVPDLTFYVIYVNYFYSRDRPDTSTDFVPAEMAICEFSLAEGIKRTLHQIINVTVEIGFARETREHADNTHKIPTDHPQGEGDYSKIYEKFRAFLKSTEDLTGKLPIIYTCKKFSTTVSCFLDRVTAAAEIPKDTFTLYSLECLFGKLMTLCNPDLDPNCNPIILADTELQKGCFSYSPNMECAYHAKIEGTSIHCSLAIIRQWCFTICDYCCNSFGIEMIPDVHCPAASITNDADSLLTSLQSLNLSKEFIPSTLKSITGVTEAHRIEKAGRTPKQEEERRKKALLQPLEIIDHSVIRPLTPPPSPESPAPVLEKPIKLPLRVPKPLALAVEDTDSAPELNVSNFPSIGGFGRGLTSVSFLLKQMRTPQLGRGRGGISLD